MWFILEAHRMGKTYMSIFFVCHLLKLILVTALIKPPSFMKLPSFEPTPPQHVALGPLLFPLQTPWLLLKGLILA